MLLTLKRPQVFPGDLQPHNYPDPHNRRRLIARSEVERRKPYFTRLYQQLGESHPLVQLVERCLDNDPEYRPSAVYVLQQLEAVEVEDPYQHLTKLDMIRLLQQRADPQREEEFQRLQTQVQQMQVMSLLECALPAACQYTCSTVDYMITALTEFDCSYCTVGRD